jgi:hypothetical protein
LSEFLELDENEFDGQRPYITGHNRYCTGENLYIEEFGKAFEKVNVQKLSFIFCRNLICILFMSPFSGVDSASNRTEYQKIFLGTREWPVHKDNLTAICEMIV